MRMDTYIHLHIYSYTFKQWHAKLTKVAVAASASALVAVDFNVTMKRVNDKLCQYLVSKIFFWHKTALLSLGTVHMYVFICIWMGEYKRVY